MGNADVGQPLLNHHPSRGPLHYVDVVDVAVTHLPHLLTYFWVKFKVGGIPATVSQIRGCRQSHFMVSQFWIG